MGADLGCLADLPLTFDARGACPFEVTISSEAAHDWSREKSLGGDSRLPAAGPGFTNIDSEAAFHGMADGRKRPLRHHRMLGMCRTVPSADTFHDNGDL